MIISNSTFGNLYFEHTILTPQNDTCTISLTAVFRKQGVIIKLNVHPYMDITLGNRLKEINWGISVLINAVKKNRGSSSYINMIISAI